MSVARDNVEKLRSGVGGGAVDSVNNKTGVVVLNTDDISEGVSNQYYTDGRADTAITSRINDTTPSSTGLYSSERIDALTTGTLNYKGAWDANTNQPPISNATGVKNDFYKVSVSGSQDLGGGLEVYNVGDDVIHNGTAFEDFANESAVTSVNSKVGAVVVNQSDVGLGEVDNTSDVDKPISTATQLAFNDKSPTTHNHDTVYEPKNTNVQAHIARVDNPHTVTKAQVGLSNVDNTADADKPISSSTAIELDKRLEWKNVWSDGASYNANDVVVDGVWTMVANTDTTEKAGIVRVGDPQYLYSGSPSTQSDTANQVIIGTRYNFPTAFELSKIRIDTIIGNTYRVYSIEDPLGVAPIIREAAHFLASTNGWLDINVPAVIIRGGVVIDLIVQIHEAGGATTTFNGNWDYSTPNNDGAPAAGEIVHSNSDTDIVNIHTTDSDTQDRTADLASLSVGDIITLDTIEWVIQGSTNNTTYFTFAVTPPIQYSSDGVTNVVFELSVATPIVTVVDSDYNLSNANISGLYIVDGSYSDIIPDNNQYGADIYLQDISMSSDWDILATSASASGSSSGSGATTFIALTDTPTSFVGKAGYRPVVNSGENALVFEAPSSITAESKATGLINGGELNMGNATDIQVIGGTGIIVDSYTNPNETPIITLLSWPQLDETISDATPSAGDVVYYTLEVTVSDGPLANTKLASLKQYGNVQPTPEQYRDEVYLGYSIYNGTEWGEVSAPIVVNNTATTVAEYIKTVAGPSFIQSGGKVTEDATLFSLNRASGVVWELNRNWHVNKKDPHRESFLEQLAFPFRYATSTNAASALTTVIEPTQYDNSGTLTAIPGNNDASIQRVYVDQRDNYWVLYGQQYYTTFDDAVANLAADTTNTTVPTFLAGAIQLGYVISRPDATDWADGESEFYESTEGGSGGVPAPTITVENILTSTSTVNALSANMGREIYDKTIVGSY